LCVGSAVAFGSSGPLAKSAMDLGISPAMLTTVRIGLAALLLTVAVAIFRPRALRFARSEWGLLFGYGLLGVAGSQLLFFVAVAHIPVSIAMLLEFLAPAFVALWVRFVRRSPLSFVVWLGIGLALAGLAMVAQVWQGLSLDPIGLAAGVGSGLTTTGYYLLGEHAAQRHDPFGLLAIGMIVGTVVVSVVAPPWVLPFGSMGEQTTLGGVHFPVWLVLSAVAILSTVVAYVTGLLALRDLPSSAASVLGLLEPVTATVLAWWLIGQRLSAVQLLGGAVLLFGAVLVQVATRTHVPPEPEPV
jgi:drug/metabolite transporter (DMT)-like permease